ncbi:MAG: sulfatase-like hydrolase/transferase, partial [Planctomycetota bacterium]
RVDALPTNDGRTAAKTMRDLERLAKGARPFFVACGFAKPHMPFYSPAPAWKPYPIKEIELAEYRERPLGIPFAARRINEQRGYVPMNHKLSRKLKYNSDLYHRHMRQGYYASITHADDLLGRLLDKLEELRISDNTYVVVIGDHGWLLGEHNEWAKNTLLYEALRTAMWVAGPGVVQNKSADTFVEFVDIYPTLCELVGIQITPSTINGKSFSKVLKSPSAEHRQHAYSRFEKGDAITTDKFQYVLWKLDDGTEEALLVDRHKDPHAKENISGKPVYRDTESELRDEVLKRIAEAKNVQLSSP